MTHVYIDPSQLGIWVNTWWKRDGVRDATLASLDASDSAGRYQVRRQTESDCCVQFFCNVMRELCETYTWVLRIEDDVLVNRHIVHNVTTWPAPHVEPKFGMGFLSVTHPVLADKAHVGYGEKLKTPWRKHRGMHFGGGLLWKSSDFLPRIHRIQKCLCEWRPMFAAAVCPSSILFDDGLRSYFHLPSLVKIDLSIPRSRDDKLIGEAVYGTQPFDADFRR